MTSSNGNVFNLTVHLYGEFTGHRWIPRPKASDAELWCFLWSATELTIEAVHWDALTIHTTGHPTRARNAGIVWCAFKISWWRYKMETFSVLLALSKGDSPNKQEAGDLRRHRAHYGVTVMYMIKPHVHGFFNNVTDFHEVNQHLPPTRPLGSVGSQFDWQSEDEEPTQNGFLFLSLTQKANIATQSSQNYLESRRFVFDDRRDLPLYKCARSGPRDCTLRDWSRAWPTLTWLAKLVGVAVNCSVRNTIFPHILKPWKSRANVG